MNDSERAERLEDNAEGWASKLPALQYYLGLLPVFKPAGDGCTQGHVEEVLVALADPKRRRLLDALSAHPQTTATALAEKLPVSRRAIVKHLAVLEQAGLVEAYKHGRGVQFAVRPARLESTARWMHRVAAAWDERLNAIKRLAEER